MPRVRVASASEIAVGSAATAEVGGVAIALYHRPEGWFAIEHTCTHRGGPLAEGDVEGFVVTCPWHGGQFDIRTGDVLGPPPTRSVRAFPVVVDGEDVSLEVS
jgi:nitrite reductase/ring-hydroxylating ferredoxin subunit